jgi:spoIIIJ-associated protein
VEWVETTGRTIEEAKDAALDQLGVDESEAEFEVLEQPRSGLFGRLRGEARIRARVRPARPRPKTERRDRGRRRDREKSEGGPAAKPAGERGGRRGAGRDPAKEGDTAGAAVSGGRGGAGSGSGSGSGGGGGRGRGGERRQRAGSSGRGRGGRAATPEDAPRERGGSEPAVAGAGTGAVDDEVDANGSRAVATEGREMTDDDVTVEQQADLMEEFLSGLLGAFGVKGTIERTAVDEDTIEMQVAGDDLGLLIGPKGQTLLAVQDLARTFVQRKATGVHQGRVRIDVGGYRQRRREALQRFTRQVATEVSASGMQKALEPMAAGDRKVVHDEVNLIDGVRTISEGEEPRRRVVIIPE